MVGEREDGGPMVDMVLAEDGKGLVVRIDE